MDENMETTGKSASGPGSQWRPPVYTQSRSCEMDADLAKAKRLVGLQPMSREIEHYKVLRSRIQQQFRKKGWKTLMITSAYPGEGKTLTAVNLALTFSLEFNQTILLVDCNLRNQQIHSYLGIKGDRGIVDFMIGRNSLSELIVWPGIEKLTVISGGEAAVDSAEFMASEQMRALVKEMRDRYDDRYIIFDVPAVLSGADAISFAPLVDGILMVVEAGKTDAADIRRALELIPEEKFMGFVLNRTAERNGM